MLYYAFDKDKIKLIHVFADKFNSRNEYENKNEIKSDRDSKKMKFGLCYWKNSSKKFQPLKF